jgi:hypothetical protein
MLSSRLKISKDGKMVNLKSIILISLTAIVLSGCIGMGSEEMNKRNFRDVTEVEKHDISMDVKKFSGYLTITFAVTEHSESRTYYTYDDKRCKSIWGPLVCSTKNNQQSSRNYKKNKMLIDIVSRNPRLTLTNAVFRCDNVTEQVVADYIGNNTFKISNIVDVNNTFIEGVFSFDELVKGRNIVINANAASSDLTSCF